MGCLKQHLVYCTYIWSNTCIVIISMCGFVRICQAQHAMFLTPYQSGLLHPYKCYYQQHLMAWPQNFAFKHQHGLQEAAYGVAGLN